MSQSKNFNELMEILVNRRSVRRYDSRYVPTEDEVKQMVTAAHLAPSAGNSRNRRFIAVFSQDVKNSMKQAVEDKISFILSKINSPRARREFELYAKAYYTFFASAPVVFAVVMKPYDSISRRIIKMSRIEEGAIPSSSAGIQGVSAAIENLLLAATSLGYGSCWMTGPLIARFELEKILGIKPPEELAALVPVGKSFSEKEKSDFGLSSDKAHRLDLPSDILQFIR